MTSLPAANIPYQQAPGPPSLNPRPQCEQFTSVLNAQKRTRPQSWRGRGPGSRRRVSRFCQDCWRSRIFVTVPRGGEVEGLVVPKPVIQVRGRADRCHGEYPRSEGRFFCRGRRVFYCCGKLGLRLGRRLQVLLAAGGLHLN